MAAVIGYLVVAIFAVVIALLVAGPHHVVERDPTFELEDVVRQAGSDPRRPCRVRRDGCGVPRHPGAQRSRPRKHLLHDGRDHVRRGVHGYFSSSVLFANVSHRAVDTTFDLAAAQYAGASISLFSVFLGWFALKPLFETFGLTTIASLTGWLLIGAVVVGFGQLGSSLYRSGYASARLIVVLGLLAAAGTIAYAILIGALAPGLRSPAATLNLTLVAFIAGVPAYGAMTILPIAAHRPRLAPILADRWHLAIVAYAEAVSVLIGFLLLSVFGLA